MKQRQVKIAWFGQHFGEEPPLVGSREQGAGGIFFAGCNLRCVFCQNYQISQSNLGRYYNIPELAEIMLRLADEGAVNIDLVTPTIWAEPIKEAIAMARHQGLRLPVVWNSNAYESTELIKSLRGLVDIYLPDFKYSDDRLAYKYSHAKDYSIWATAAIATMWSEVGPPKFDRAGLMTRGLIVRHLILPNAVDNSLGVLDILARIDPSIFISLMTQYYPLQNAPHYPEINRRITAEEFNAVQDYQLKLGLNNGWYQELEDTRCFIPDFTQARPFN